MAKARGAGVLAISLAAVTGQSAAAETADVAPQNPGFEQSTPTGEAPVGWIHRGSRNASFVETGGHGGSARLTHWSAEDFAVDTRQTVAGLHAGWYTLSAWVRRSAGNNNSYLELGCGHQRERVYLPVSATDQWLHVVVSARAVRHSCVITLHTDASRGEWAHFDDVELAAGAARLSMLGADVSSLAKSEALGGQYFDERVGAHACQAARSALDILAEHGASHVRVRVWVEPADGYHDLLEAREVARRARRAGLGVLAAPHYSDTWADPGRQTKPSAWADYSTNELAQAVYAHTREVCLATTVEGRGPDIVQLGNELNAGMLWPDGHTYAPPRWDDLAAFLRAGYQAVKDCSPATKVMLHLADGGDSGLSRWWFDNVTSRGVRFDVIGLSYYGYWHGSLGGLQLNLDDLAARYDKDVVIAETAYPFTLGFGDEQPNVIGLESQLVPGYPASPEGQARQFRDVLSIVRAVPDGRGLGAFYWDATWTPVPGNGWDPGDAQSGNNWENQALFDFDGQALPAMKQFRR